MAATAGTIEGTKEDNVGTTATKLRGGDRVNTGGRRGGSSLERITVNLAIRTSEALDQLTRITGDSKTDTVNKALQVFAYLQQIQRDDGAIYVREPGSNEIERLKIF
jgi:hypothetical protein